MEALIVIAIVGGLALLVVGGWIVSIYNNLIQVKNNVEKAFNNIDVLLQQRHDELPKLIDAVKGYMTHEKSILLALTEIREAYNKAKGSEQKTDVENELNRNMFQLASRWEQYPALKADGTFLQLQGRMSALESSIADRREFYNDSINIFNIQIERFPDILLAMLMRYHKRAYLEIPDEKKKDVKIELGG